MGRCWVTSGLQALPQGAPRSPAMALLALLPLLALAAASPAPRFDVKSGIVGGQEAEPHHFPWQISLQYIDIFPHHYHTCGATIIDSLHIACAAHCIDGRQKAWFLVKAGVHNVKQLFDEDTVQRRHVADMWRHENYDHYHTCGATIIDSGVNNVDEGMICSGIDEGGISACSGDSGGPLACPDQNGTMYLAGIVSWGMIPCGQANRPSVFTSVGYFRDWIDEHIAM